MTAYDLVAVGDVMLDVRAPEPSEIPRHGTIDVAPGGSAVNAGRAAVAAGRTALVVGCVGDDEVGELVRRDVRASGLDAHLAVVSGARTGRAVYTGDAVAVERGANTAFLRSHLPARVEGRAVLVSGYQLFRDDSGEGAREAFALGGLVGVDLGRAGVVRSFGAARARGVVEGAAVVFGDAAAIAELGDVPGARAVTTHGPDGASADGHHARPAVVHPTSVVGAGDAFAAVFLIALADGASLGDALQAGCDAGAAAAGRTA